MSSDFKVEVSVDNILKKAESIFKNAEMQGIPIPKHISLEFKQLLYHSYRDTLDAYAFDANYLGYILGNSSRWDLPLCRFFTLNFLEFFASSLPEKDRQKLKPALLNSDKNIVLDYYTPLQISENYTRHTATLFLSESRTIAIKANILYPNVAKAKAARRRDQYSYKWVNLRYKKSDSGNVSIIKLPRIQARLEGGKFTTEGLLKNSVGGDIIKYSFCTLAQSLKTLCGLCLELLIDNKKEDIKESSFSPMVKFTDLLNLIYKRNYKFYVTSPYVPEGDLFNLNTHTLDNFEYRINGDSTVYIIFGSLNKLKALNQLGLIEEAFKADVFNVNRVNIEDFVEDDEPVYGLLFEALTAPSAERQDVSFWSLGTEIGEYEILDEFQINQMFGLDF